MSSFGTQMKNHFLNTYAHKDYIQYYISPKPYSSPVFTINWFIPNFIEKRYLVEEISNQLSIEKYPGRVIIGIVGNYLLDHPRFSGLISIEINPGNLNQSMYDLFITDFESLINKYERVYEIKKPFSSK